MESLIYFAKEGEQGITETSAAHLCAVASQIKKDSETFLENVTFINTEITIIGSDKTSLSHQGYTPDEVGEIVQKLSTVCKMNAFIAWFAEARSVLEAYKKERQNLSMQDWAKEQGITVPESPTYEYDTKRSTLEDIVAQMPLKERQEYLSLEARVAAIGKFIHPNKPLSAAYEDMLVTLRNKRTLSGSGRDTVIKYSYPSVDSVEISNLINNLQATHRNLEGQLNQMKSTLRTTLKEVNTKEIAADREYDLEYNKKRDAYYAEMRELTSQYNEWTVQENARLAKIRFVIPNGLKATYEYLNNIG